MLSALDDAGTAPLASRSTAALDVLSGFNASQPSSPGGISVPFAIVLGLLASFVQSLGLTIQRKAHVQNESLPLERRRKSEWRDPLWLFGFAIFIASNIGGTVFQIGALPIVMLAPLGAVSLLYNALLARFILNDFLSSFMVIGTALIAAGAVLIGYFGVVPEKPHSLDELLGLYARPAFVAFASVAFLIFIGVLSLAHLTEWQLEARIQRDSAEPQDRKVKRKRSLRRRWSAPNLATVAEVSETMSGIATPILDIVDEAARRGLPADRLIAAARDANPQRLAPPVQSSSHGTLPRNAKLDYGAMADSSAIDESTSTIVTAPKAKVKPPILVRTDSSNALNTIAIRRTRLGLSVAYGGASGTLSGVCLLLAKSGVELLVLTFSGDNQFLRWQSWMLVGVMLIAALLQLWYLNKSLKLSDPTLVCPLAFCFYNTSSIVLGLVYFDQLGSLAWYDLVLVAVGTCVLLTGVWVVSLHGSSSSGGGEAEEGDADPVSMLEAGEATSSTVLEAENTTETEALLSNAAGIAGPHLPPPAPASSSPTSPSTPLSRRASRQSRSSSFSSIRGLGVNAAGLRIDEPTPSPGSPLTVDTNTSRSARHALYTSFLERGLSIGISPSSPGFYLPPPTSSPSDERAPLSASERRKRRLARRTFSEADVPSTSQDNVEGSALGDDEDADGDGNLTRSSSAFGLNFGLDSDGLKKRLASLRRSQRRWLPWGVAGHNVPEDEETGTVADPESRPLLSENHQDSR